MTNFSNVNILSSINADMALETPQVLLTWEFENELPRIDTIRLQRSTYCYPEDISEGTNLLAEPYNKANPRTSFSDTTVEPNVVYYYTLFFEHYGAFSTVYAPGVPKQHNLERLGVKQGIIRATIPIRDEVIGTADDVTTTFIGNLSYALNKPGRNKLHAYTTTGTLMTIYDNGQGNLVGSIGAGTNTINYITGVYDVTFSSPPAVAYGDPLANYESPTDNLFIIGKNNEGVEALWTYNYVTELVEKAIDLSDIFTLGEVAIGIGHVTYNYTLTNLLKFIFVTNTRLLLLEWDYTLDPTYLTAADHVVGEFDLDQFMTPGYNIVGVCWDRNTTTGYNRVRIIDSANLEAKRVRWSNGTVEHTMDLSGFVGENGELRGAFYDPENHWIYIGNDKTYFAFDSQNASPTPDTCLARYPVKQKIDGDVDLLLRQVSQLHNAYDLLELFDFNASVIYDELQLEQRALPGSYIAGLWHMDEESGDLIDVSGHGNNGTITDGTQGIEGKFDKAVLLEETGSVVTFPISGFDKNNGGLGFWWKEPYKGYFPSSNAWSRLLGTIFTGVLDQLYITAGSDNILYGVFRRNNINNAVSTSLTDISDQQWHHIALTWDPTDLKLFIDGVEKDSITMSGAVIGNLITINLGSSAFGYYDDFYLSTFDQSPYSLIVEYSQGNKAHALSGRDYDTSNLFPFRNNLFKYFSDFVQRNDYNRQYLLETQVLSNNEKIFLETRSKETYLGDMGRLSRLFGLLLDRNIDRRAFFMNHVTATVVEDEFISTLGATIDATEFDEDWNVDKKRRFLEVTYFCDKAKGTLDSFVRMARFLGFLIWAPNNRLPQLVLRRRFDSVIDTNRPDAPFDTGIFDSGASDVPFTKLRFLFFKPNEISDDGATSIPATREFIDAGAQFTMTAEPGSLLKIYDPDDVGDNGQFMVESVTNDTTLVITEDWLEGSLSGLSYTIAWQVPKYDPYVDQLLSRFLAFKGRWQQLEYQNIEF